jgi:UTP--glucose-1-phosphate uridylyltransferase
MSRTVRKVVIPAAGLGTRLLPATKVVPKELLPISGRPMIQFAVEEAVASGAELVILVVSEAKSLIVQHFSRNLELETLLTRTGRAQQSQALCRLAQMVEVRTVVQEAPLGLADAVGKTRSLIGAEPFAVILPDALIDSEVPAIAQLARCYEKYPGCIVATRRVSPSEVEGFGILDLVVLRDCDSDARTFRVMSLTERPSRGAASSDYGIFGRYILEPEIFDFVDSAQPGFGGELQLTDALERYSRQMPVYAYEFAGRHYDAGSKLGFLRATLAFSRKDPELGPPLSEYLDILESARPEPLP